jgi:hypothetical protein
MTGFSHFKAVSSHQTNINHCLQWCYRERQEKTDRRHAEDIRVESVYKGRRNGKRVDWIREETTKQNVGGRRRRKRKYTNNERNIEIE